MKVKQLLPFVFLGTLLSGCLNLPSSNNNRGENAIVQTETPPPQASSKNLEIVKNSLNIYNSKWDNFSGYMGKGKSYYCNNAISHRALRFKVRQVISENEFLISRSSAYDGAKEICENAIFWLLAKTNYADDAVLRDGEYICLGTYQYENKKNEQKTVYLLIEKDFLDEYARDSK